MMGGGQGVKNESKIQALIPGLLATLDGSSAVPPTLFIHTCVTGEPSEWVAAFDCALT